MKHVDNRVADWGRASIRGEQTHTCMHNVVTPCWQPPTSLSMPTHTCAHGRR